MRNGLVLRGLELSGDIANVLRDRARTAPPRPQRTTWQHDENAMLRYEQETATLFEAEFVRASARRVTCSRSGG